MNESEWMKMSERNEIENEKEWTSEKKGHREEVVVRGEEEEEEQIGKNLEK